MTGLNPFDWTAGSFLTFYALALIGAIALGRVIVGTIRPEGRRAVPADIDELAVLAGGSRRLTESVVARLGARGAAWVGEDGIVLEPQETSASEAERQITRLSSPAKWSAIRKCLAIVGEQIEDRLIARELLMSGGEARRLGLYGAVPMLLLIGVGLVRYANGVALDRPVGLLTFLLLVTALAALLRVFVVDRRTKAGLAVLADEQERSDRLRRAPTNDEMGTAVALYGTAVLVGSPLADFHGYRDKSSGDSGGGGCGGGGSSGDGGGGGGCGGGGCGG